MRITKKCLQTKDNYEDLECITHLQFSPRGLFLMARGNASETRLFKLDEFVSPCLVFRKELETMLKYRSCAAWLDWDKCGGRPGESLAVFSGVTVNRTVLTLEVSRTTKKVILVSERTERTASVGRSIVMATSYRIGSSGRVRCVAVLDCQSYCPHQTHLISVGPPARSGHHVTNLSKDPTEGFSLPG